MKKLVNVLAINFKISDAQLDTLIPHSIQLYVEVKGAFELDWFRMSNTISDCIDNNLKKHHSLKKIILPSFSTDELTASLENRFPDLEFLKSTKGDEYWRYKKMDVREVDDTPDKSITGTNLGVYYEMAIDDTQFI